jgi:predicted enzyme related to lactoylglutathione lyase
MIQGIKLFVYPVSNIEKATELYKKLLGVEPYMALPYYVGFRLADLEIGLDPHGHQKGPGPICYWQVKDIRKSLETFQAAGAKVRDAVKDVGGGRLIASAADADGNVTWLLQT